MSILSLDSLIDDSHVVRKYSLSDPISISPTACRDATVARILSAAVMVYGDSLPFTIQKTICTLASGIVSSAMLVHAGDNGADVDFDEIESYLNKSIETLEYIKGKLSNQEFSDTISDAISSLIDDICLSHKSDETFGRINECPPISEDGSLPLTPDIESFSTYREEVKNQLENIINETTFDGQYLSPEHSAVELLLLGIRILGGAVSLYAPGKTLASEITFLLDILNTYNVTNINTISTDEVLKTWKELDHVLETHISNILNDSSERQEDIFLTQYNKAIFEYQIYSTNAMTKYLKCRHPSTPDMENLPESIEEHDDDSTNDLSTRTNNTSMQSGGNWISMLIIFAGLFAKPLSLVIHVMTIIVAYEAKGIAAAVVSCCLPIVSQIYWFFAIGNRKGYTSSPYCISIMVWIALVLIAIAGVALASKNENKK